MSNEPMIRTDALIDPKVAIQVVSRQEVVNLIVQEYIEKINEQLKPLYEEEKKLQNAFESAKTEAYTAWRDQVLKAGRNRVQPWAYAIQKLTEKVYTPATSSAIPDSFDKAPYRRDEPSIVIAFHYWMRPDIEPNRDIAPLVSSIYGDPVSLSAIEIEWWLPIKESGVRFPSIAVKTDLRPNDTTWSTILNARSKQEELSTLLHQISDLNELIAEENIGKLEKKALARMTKQALGELSTKLPQLTIK